MKKDTAPKNQNMPERKKTPVPDPLGGFFRSFAVVVLVIVLLAGIGSRLSNRAQSGKTTTTEVSLAEFAQKITAGSVKEITIRGQKVEGVVSETESITTKKEPESTFAEQMQVFGVVPASLAQVQLTVKNENGVG